MKPGFLLSGMKLIYPSADNKSLQLGESNQDKVVWIMRWLHPLQACCGCPWTVRGWNDADKAHDLDLHKRLTVALIQSTNACLHGIKHYDCVTDAVEKASVDLEVA